MKKVIAIILFVAAATGFGYVVVQNKQLNTRYTETRQVEATVREQFSAAIQSIAEIQDSLNVILPVEERLSVISRNAEMGSSVTQTQKQQMLGIVEDLKQSVGNTRQKIEALEKSLDKNKTEMAGLQRVIDNLKKSVTEREQTIRQLTGEIESLTLTVAGLKTDVQRGQEMIAEQQGMIETTTKELGTVYKELGTVYYVVATKDQLKERGIITEKGGFIGIGKTPQLTTSFNGDDFTAMDTNLSTEIPLTGVKPQVLSAQSKESYELQLLADEKSKLVIRDAPEFRKVKYVVVMVEEA